MHVVHGPRDNVLAQQGEGETLLHGRMRADVVTLVFALQGQEGLANLVKRLAGRGLIPSNSSSSLATTFSLPPHGVTWEWHLSSFRILRPRKSLRDEALQTWRR
eukprot:scaffold6164_cov163-Amphora_coffeaeformis.AAC.5